MVRSDEIEPHLEWLLGLIEPRAAQLAEVRSTDLDGEVDCFWASAGIGGGPWVSPGTMRTLAALDLPLVISFYTSDGEP